MRGGATEHPLSAGQRALWFLDRLAPGNAAYNLPAALRLRSRLDLAALRRAAARLALRQPALRATLGVREGRPFQKVQARAGLEVRCFDARGWPAAELERRVEDEAWRPFDLEGGRLARIAVFSVARADHVLLLCLHHVVGDLRSLAIVAGELGSLWAEEAGGPAAQLPPLLATWDDFVAAEEGRLAGPDGARLWEYWRRRLAGEPPALELPADRPRPPAQTFAGSAVVQDLGRPLSAAVRALARETGATLFTVLVAAWQVFLHRITGAEDLVVGTPASLRDPRLAGLAGYFVNPVPLRGDLAGDPRGSDALERLHRAAAEDLAHRDLPFPLLVERLEGDRDPSRSPLFQTMLVLYKEGSAEEQAMAGCLAGRSGVRLRLGPLRAVTLRLAERACPFELDLRLAEIGGSLQAALRFNTDLFDPSTAHRLLDGLVALLAGLAAEPSQPLSALPLLGPAALHQVAAEWNDTAAAGPDACVHHLVAAQVERTPAAVAVVGDDRSLTYAGLAAEAGRVARRLRLLGIGPEARVAVCVERSTLQVVALLGVLAAGGAYVPLDPAHPRDRLEQVLGDASPRLLLTQRSLEARLPRAGAPAVCLEDVLEAADSPDSSGAAGPSGAAAPLPDNLAYVLYTSGSTGRPKGVQISHRALAGFLLSLAQRPGLTPRDTLLAITTLTFDIAGLEIFLPLVTGARLVVASREVAVDPARLARALAETGATVLQATPVTWRLLVAAGWSAPRRLTAFCGGEALQADLAAALVERGVTLWNLYGPTETTIWSSLGRIDAAPPAGPVPIGRPIENTVLRVLDPGLRPRPAGVPGELLIGGAGLARGYLDQPGLTAERFVPDPGGGEPGARLYRTGDLVRQRADGSLEYLHRLDHQVKIRGHRIEPGEVEACLLRHPDVGAAVVMAREGAPGDVRLVAWLTPAEPARRPDAGALARFLRERLPLPMVPSAFVVLDRFPLTPGGKVDRRALPAPAVSRPAPDTPSAAAGALDLALAGIWREVLQVDEVGQDDSFFDLGGHSLLLFRVQDLLRRQLGREVAILDLFRHPTLAALARHLAEPEAGDRPAAERGAEERRARRGAPAVPGIAIVGMSCRFPGSPDVETWWRNLREGVETISFFSAEELAASGVPPEVARDPAYVPAAGVVEGAAGIEPAFFGLGVQEARRMDPQQRVFLECAWEALEHAGYDPARFPGRIGVYAGAGLNAHGLAHLARALDPRLDPLLLAVVNDRDYLAARVAYRLGLRGPSLGVGTACSTSLVAVDLACQALREGACDLALAGAVRIAWPQKAGYLYRRGGIFSPDGHCRAFDARAAGTVLGSGAGIVVLKRLDEAVAGGDTIHAVLRATAVNNDGAHRIGFTAPSVDGQAALLREALARAEVDPATIGYVEAHGTGTPLGDLVEIAALNRAYASRTLRAAPCFLGSAETNVGHLDVASGMAGLIKAVLAVREGEIPPTLHFHSPHPELDFRAIPLAVNTELRAWPEGMSPRRAGVSSFGLGGTNAHVILEEPPAVHSAPSRDRDHLLVLSARTPEALEEATDRLAEHLRRHPGLDLADVAYTLQMGRAELEHRRAVLCRTARTAVERLARRQEIRAGEASLPASLARLWLAGARVDWQVLHAGEARRRVPLPTCPFQRRPLESDAWRRLSVGGDETEEPRRREPPADAPQGALEQRLAAIWERLLEVSPIGRHDDFFGLGGHSLLAVTLAAEIERETGIEVSPALLLDAATIACLARRLERRETPDRSGA